MKTYGEFMREQMHRDDMIGDLANDMETDGILTDTLSPVEALSRLKLRPAAPEAMNALAQAFREFEDQQPHDD